MGADSSDEPLRQDSFERRGNQERFHAHVEQARDGAGGVVGVERAEDLMAGERGADGDLGGLRVADFADHDDVRILAQDGAQAGGESEILPGRTGIWATPASSYSTGSSMVRIFFSGRVDALRME